MQDIYIGNLPYSLDENGVKELFKPYGEVEKVTLITDHNTGKKAGYGFVKINCDNIDPIIENLDRSEYQGRTIRVSHAETKQLKGKYLPITLECLGEKCTRMCHFNMHSF